MTRSLAIALCLVFAGCARFDPRPLTPAETAKSVDGRTLDDVQLKTFFETNLHLALAEWPLRQWDLETLTAAAFYYHPSLELARAQWTTGQGGELTAAQRPNPTLNVSPGYNTTTAIPSPWLPFTILDWTVETAGKRRHRRERAAHLSEVARLNIISVAWQVRSALQSSLLDWAAADHRSANLQTQTVVLAEIVHRLEQQASAGAIAPTEILPLRISVARTRADLAEAGRQRVEARARVAEAVGVPLHALDNVSLSVPFSQAGDTSELTTADARRAAVLGRADILAALADYAADEAALHLEIARQYPDLHLQPGYQYDQGDSKWSIGLLVELPVLNQNQGPIAEARGRRLESAARFNALQTKVLADIDRSVRVLRVAETNEAALDALAGVQAARLRSISAQFETGAADRLEVLNAQLEAATAQSVLTDGLVRLLQASAALEDAVQRPLSLIDALTNTAHADTARTAQR
jgi:cobalt-zinc-cadmium efflux system outer membrane protein